MRRMLLNAAAGLTLLSGCQLPTYHESIAWEFRIGKPGSISAPTIVQQNEGPITAAGVATGPIAGPAPARAMAFAAQLPYDPCAAVPYGSPGPVGTGTLAALAPGDGCTLKTLCDGQARVESLLQQLVRQRQPEALPMPKGGP